MKKLFFLATVLVAAMTMNAKLVRVDEWSLEGLKTATPSGDAKATDTIIASFTRDGIQVLALDTKDSEKNAYNKFVAIETNKDAWKYESELTFSARLKMRGASKADTRQIIIPVKNGDKVAIYAQSGKKSEARTFCIGTAQWDGSAKGTEYTTATGESAAPVGKFEYTATADGNIYIWCPGKEVNFFAFDVPSMPTAIDNTEAEVKTVKTFENGQLVIIKNGVKYNATGAVVK